MDDRQNPPTTEQLLDEGARRLSESNRLLEEIDLRLRPPSERGDEVPEEREPGRP